MEPHAELHPAAEIVRSVAPWVWPAVAAILVGGLLVLWSLTSGSEAAAGTAGLPLTKETAARRVTKAGVDPFLRLSNNKRFAERPQ